jgi:hypothetical protein
MVVTSVPIASAFSSFQGEMQQGGSVEMIFAHRGTWRGIAWTSRKVSSSIGAGSNNTALIGAIFLEDLDLLLDCTNQIL